MIRYTTAPFLAMAFLAATSWMSGCGTSREQTSESTTRKEASEVPIDTNIAQGDLDKMLDSLMTMRDSTSTDNLNSNFGVLKSQAQSLDQALDDVHAKGDAAIAAGNDQIAQWRKQSDQFTDSDLRKASDKRQSDLRHAVDALAASNVQMKSTSDAYRSELDQTLKALGFDLSPTGVKSIDPASDKLRHDAPQLREALNDVQNKSNDMLHMINS